MFAERFVCAVVLSSEEIPFNSPAGHTRFLPRPGSVRRVWQRAAGLLAAAVLAGVAAPPLHAAPLYVLSYAFTNWVSTNQGVSGFTTRAVAGINDAGDVCGSFVTSNALDNATNTVTSVYLLRTNGVIYDLFPRGVTPLVLNAYANNLTQRRADGSLQIVGSVAQADGFQRGAIWTVGSNGAISSFIVLTNRVLGTNSVAPGEQGYGEANAINDAGYVVGDGNSYHAEDALSWTPPYATEPSYWIWNDGAVALGVDDQNVVLVNADFRNSVFPYNYYEGAALLYGGSPTELPAASTNIPEDDAFAMSGPTVVGQAYFGTNAAEFPFAWERGDTAITPLPPPDGMAYGINSCEADAVNTNADIVGYVYNTNYFSANGSDFYPGAYYTLWKQDSSGTLRAWRGYALDALLPAQPGFRTFTGSYYPDAYDIALNNSGAIALHFYGSGSGYNYQGKPPDAVLVYQPVDTGIVQFFNTNTWLSGSYGGFAAIKSDGVLTASVELLRADGYLAPVTVHFATSDGDGLAGQDYTATNGDLVWGYGEVGFKTIVVPVVTNNYEYGNRTFYLDLSGPNGAQLGMNHAPMEIYNEDYETVDFTNYSPLDYTYDVRAGTTNVVVTLDREYSPDGTMVITNLMTLDGSAVAGVDYVAVTNTMPVTWKPGQAGSIACSIPLLDSTNLAWPLSFNVEADGTIDATNPITAFATVTIRPVGQTPSFQLASAASSGQSNALDLVSYVEQGLTVLLESSTNLVDWQIIGQAPCTNGVVEFAPPLAAGQPGRFFRAVIPRP